MASSTAVVWFRRDLRVRDQPVFLAAADAADRALALFVLDPALLGPSGAARRNFLHGALRELAGSPDWSPDLSLPVLHDDLVSGWIAGRSSADPGSSIPNTRPNCRDTTSSVSAAASTRAV